MALTATFNNPTLGDYPVAATVGMFDGVHLGHQWLINQLREQASRLGMRSAIITFNQHPQSVLKPGTTVAMITPLKLRMQLLNSTGVDSIITLDFTPELSQLDSTAFMKLISRDYGVKALTVGFNHRFGHNRNETYTDYRANGVALGITVEQACEYSGPAAPVSSSIIRNLINNGQVASAATKLGRYHSLTGTVVHGQHRGTALGFPTANIEPQPGTLIPANGVYAVRVITPDSLTRGGMANIGSHPTFPGGEPTLEVNIFDFDGDIYGESVTIEFIDRLRDERAMTGPQELTQQLADDLKNAHKILSESLPKL